MHWLSQPSVVNECPLMAPKTSRPLRLCVRIKICSYVLLSKKNLWVPWVPCEKFQASTRSIMSFCSSVRIIVPHRTHGTPQNLLRTTSAKVRAVCVKQSTPHGSVYSVWKIPSKDAEHYVLLFFCQNYRPTEIRVLQTPRESAPSAWNKKSPLVVPNTSRPLRENKNIFLCSSVPKNLWVPWVLCEN